METKETKDEKSKYQILSEIFAVAAKDFAEISNLLLQLDGNIPIGGKRKRSVAKKKKHWSNKDLDALENIIRVHIQSGKDLESNNDTLVQQIQEILEIKRETREILHQIDLYKKCSLYPDLHDLPFMQPTPESIHTMKIEISDYDESSKNEVSKSEEQKLEPVTKKRKVSVSPTRKKVASTPTTTKNTNNNTNVSSSNNNNNNNTVTATKTVGNNTNATNNNTKIDNKKQISNKTVGNNNNNNNSNKNNNNNNINNKDKTINNAKNNANTNKANQSPVNNDVSTPKPKSESPFKRFKAQSNPNTPKQSEEMEIDTSPITPTKSLVKTPSKEKNIFVDHKLSEEKKEKPTTTTPKAQSKTNKQATTTLSKVVPKTVSPKAVSNTPKKGLTPLNKSPGTKPPLKPQVKQLTPKKTV